MRTILPFLFLSIVAGCSSPQDSSTPPPPDTGDGTDAADGSLDATSLDASEAPADETATDALPDSPSDATDTRVDGGCTSDFACGSTEFCDLPTGKCLPDLCLSKTCGGFERCVRATGVCAAIPECAACSGGKVCDPTLPGCVTALGAATDACAGAPTVTVPSSGPAYVKGDLTSATHDFTLSGTSPWSSATCPFSSSRVDEAFTVVLPVTGTYSVKVYTANAPGTFFDAANVTLMRDSSCSTTMTSCGGNGTQSYDAGTYQAVVHGPATLGAFVVVIRKM
jgi:hypothetical protein